MIVSVLLAALLLIGLYVASHRVGGVQAIVALAVLACGIVLVVFPGLTSAIASTLNVGRGTDLLLYFAVICGLFLAAHFYFRFKRQDATMTELVRAIALRGVMPDGPPPSLASRDEFGGSAAS
jgi:hypothetical protein